MKRNVIIGLALLLSLGGLSAEGAEPRATTSARVVESAPAPTVVDRLVRTIQALPGLGRLLTTGVPAAPAAPTAPLFGFPKDLNLLDLPDCDPLLDPQVECRAHQPLGG